MSDQFVVKDSGQRQQFDSGMIRDTEAGKVDFTTVFNGPMLERWAAHLTKALQKYPNLPDGTANWMQAAGQEEYQRFRRSFIRHAVQVLRGDIDEDHKAAVMFNLNGMALCEERIAAPRRHTATDTDVWNAVQDLLCVISHAKLADLLDALGCSTIEAVPANKYGNLVDILHSVAAFKDAELAA